MPAARWRSSSSRGCCAILTAAPASASAWRNERVVAMYSLETIGFYSSDPGSQVYPAPFGLMFPDRGDFVAFVGMMRSRALVRETMRSFRTHTSFPTIEIGRASCRERVEL